MFILSDCLHPLDCYSPHPDNYSLLHDNIMTKDILSIHRVQDYISLKLAG